MERLEHLYGKYLDGSATEIEKHELFALIGQADDHALEALADAFLGREAPYYLRDLQAHTESLLEGINARIAPAPATTAKRLRRWMPYTAAAILLVASVVGYFAVVSHKSSVLPTGQAGDSLAATEILPGGNRATLTLADGRVVNLDEAQTGIVIGDENITYNDGSFLGAVMVSEAEPSLQNSRDPSTTLHSLPTGQAGAQSLPRLVGGDAPAMLSLTTPKGGTYQVTLPDGSKVWLNSASTLKYPSRFTGDTREVILDGEAYFDIVSMDHARITDARERSGSGARVSRVPFKVRTTTQTVEVLGTQFNISAYADETETKTTLVEGSVRVSGLVGAQDIAPSKSSVTIAPGQQATTREAHLEINEVDTKQYTAWKNGYFDFTGKTFPEVMRELARWYDLDIAYAGPVPDMHFYGDLERSSDFVIIKNLLESNGIAFRLEAGRRLTILGKEGGKPSQ